VHQWQDSKYRSNLAEIVQLMRPINPDVVGLVEVSGYNNFQDVHALASALGMQTIQIAEAGAGQHNVLLTRLPTNKCGNITLAYQKLETRAASYLSFSINSQQFIVYCTHLDATRESTRLKQFEILQVRIYVVFGIKIRNTSTSAFLTL
jgi:endonuclease/exonuclease/phosphatase family metal-dependent hydrolase